MIETDGPGGAEAVFLHLAEALRDRGHTVYPIGPARGQGWLSGRLRERGFDRHTFTLRRPLDPGCLARLTGTLRELEIELVHSHEFTMGFYGALAARWLGIPHFITMHGDQGVTAAGRRRLALRMAASLSDGFVVVSNELRADFARKLSLAPDSILVVPNGIPVQAGSPEAFRREIGLAPDDVLIVAVGNLRPNKAHEVLIRALAAVAKGGPAEPAWHVAVAGQGPLQRPLEEIASSLGCTERVHILGLRDDVPDLLAAADVFAMPSLAEGLPLALLEAMFAGCAIVASRVGGIPEAIEEGTHGLLVEPGDTPAWTAALASLIGDGTRRRRMGEAARARAHDRYSVSQMVDQYERIYGARWTR